MAEVTPARLCLHCDRGEPIRPDEKVWPPGWVCLACRNQVAVLGDVPSYAPSLADTVTGFDPEDFRKLVQFEQDHFWFGPRSRLIGDLVDRFFPRAASFLEVGCGTGLVLSALARRRDWTRLAGSELHPSGLTFAAGRLGGRAELVQMDARRIPAEGVFDVVGAFDVLEHIDEDETVIAAIRRALSPGGGVVVSVPQHPFLWSQVDVMAHHVRRYRRGELEAKLARAGFRIVFSSSYNAVLTPLLIASRLAGSMRTRDPGADPAPDGHSETHVTPWINSVLKAALSTEVALTRAGLRWPFGGSRIVAAVRIGD